MKILWDEPKRLKNIEKHGLDFRRLDIDFFSDALIVEAKQDRLKAVGILSDDVIAVIFVALGLEGISLISLRPASRKERNLYEQQHAKGSYPVYDPAKHFQAGRVGPMRILEDHQHRILACQCFHLGNERFQCFLPPLLWGQVERGIASIVWQR